MGVVKHLITRRWDELGRADRKEAVERTEQEETSGKTVSKVEVPGV